MNSGLQIMECVGKALPQEVVCVEELLNMFSNKRVAQPTGWASEILKMAMQEVHGAIYRWAYASSYQNCTEAEVHRQLGKNEESTTLDKLHTFISIFACSRYIWCK
ncbi:hypothetical protein TNCT_217581 [Trichonephila clavata]|uniref:Uncharacterized protein n=1 Tax=Trichonephila clavata TaxID=2740835 RepID=A0A8X6JBP5_TRICU|nr:hypothetical protein TNCT_217581 [Trichonephila clavata]